MDDKEHNERYDDDDGNDNDEVDIDNAYEEGEDDDVMINNNKKINQETKRNLSDIIDVNSNNASSISSSSAVTRASSPKKNKTDKDIEAAREGENEKDIHGEDEHPFFVYYGQIVHQQNMLQDYVRTGTYQAAIARNKIDFKDKVIMDVGTGTGILAMFCCGEAGGARLCYAVEASDMYRSAEQLIRGNGFTLQDIKVIHSKVEDIELELESSAIRGYVESFASSVMGGLSSSTAAAKIASGKKEKSKIHEKVDVIISEPMGFMLVHERMLESFVLARQKFLKPGGRMFPTRGTIYCLPFSDQSLYNEQMSRPQFWKTKDFFGFDMRSLEKQAIQEIFSQAVVGYFDPSILLASEEYTAKHIIDFETCTIEDHLTKFQIPLSFAINQTALLHGLACWFDVDFLGSEVHTKVSIILAHLLILLFILFFLPLFSCCSCFKIPIIQIFIVVDNKSLESRYSLVPMPHVVS